MRRMPAQEISQYLGRVLRDQPEFKAASPGRLPDMNERISAVCAALVRAIDTQRMMVIATEDGSHRFGVEEPDPAGPARWYDGYMGGAHDGSASRRGEN